MKVRYYILIALIVWGTMLYYVTSDNVSYPWTIGITLFCIGEVFFALGMGKMLKRNREYHENEIWNG